MTAVSRPLYWSVGVPFNELFWASSTGALTENAANLLYLQKTVADTASALETFSGGLLTNSVGALAITSNLEIATSQTSGILNIGTLATREAAAVINIGASGGLHTIVMDTSSLANSNAAPAISIGTSASAKTIKINNNSNSVHCSSIDLKGASINHIVANSATPITIGDGQTTSVGGLLIGCSAAGNVRTSAPIKIGADSTSTGVITIGASGSSTSMLGSTTVPTLTFPSNLSNAVNSAYLTSHYVPNSTDTTLAGIKTFTSTIIADGGITATTYNGSTPTSEIYLGNTQVSATGGISIGTGLARSSAISIGTGNASVIGIGGSGLTTIGAGLTVNGMLTASGGITLPTPITLSYTSIPTFAAGQIGHRVQVNRANFTMTGIATQNVYTYTTLPIGVYILQAQLLVNNVNYNVNFGFSATSATQDVTQLTTSQGALAGHVTFSTVWPQTTASNIYVIISSGTIAYTLQFIYLTYTRIA